MTVIIFSVDFLFSQLKIQDKIKYEIAHSDYRGLVFASKITEQVDECPSRRIFTARKY